MENQASSTTYKQFQEKYLPVQYKENFLDRLAKKLTSGKAVVRKLDNPKTGLINYSLFNSENIFGCFDKNEILDQIKKHYGEEEKNYNFSIRLEEKVVNIWITTNTFKRQFSKS